MSDLSLKVVVLFVDFISIAKYVVLIAVVALVLVTILIKTAAFAAEVICRIVCALTPLMTKPVAEAIVEFRKVRESLASARESILDASHRPLTPPDDQGRRVRVRRIQHAGHVYPTCDRRQTVDRRVSKK